MSVKAMKQIVAAVGASGIAVVLCLFVGCKPSPQSIARQAKYLGVYELTGRHLKEIQTYGRERDDLYAAIHFAFSGPIMKGPKSAVFVVNLPGSISSGAQLYLLMNPQAVIPMEGNSGNAKPIQARIKPLTKDIYEVFPAKSIKTEHPKYLCLYVVMPPGIPDRLYALDISR